MAHTEEMEALERLCLYRFWAYAISVILFVVFVCFGIAGWIYDAPVSGGHWEDEIDCRYDGRDCAVVGQYWVEEKDYSEAPLYAIICGEYFWLYLIIGLALFYAYMNGIVSSLGDKIKKMEPIAAAKEITYTDPDNSIAHNNLGVALLDRGDINGAIKEFESATKLNPEDSLIQKNLSIAQKRNKNDKA